MEILSYIRVRNIIRVANCTAVRNTIRVANCTAVRNTIRVANCTAESPPLEADCRLVL